MIDLAAKAAADIGCDHAQLRFRQMQHMGTHQQANDMRVLAGSGEGIIARRAIKLANRRTRFHGIRDQAVIHQIELDQMRGASEGGVHHGLVANMPIIAEIAGDIIMNGGGTRLQRCCHGGGGWQHIIINNDGFRSIARLLACGGNRDRNGVPHMAHLVLRQHRMRRFGHGRTILIVDLPAARQAAHIILRHIGAGIDFNHTRHGSRRGDINGIDARMGMRAAQDPGMQLAGLIRIIRIGATPLQEAEILLAADAGADAFKRCHHVHFCRLPSG